MVKNLTILTKYNLIVFETFEVHLAFADNKNIFGKVVYGRQLRYVQSVERWSTDLYSIYKCTITPILYYHLYNVVIASAFLAKL